MFFVFSESVTRWKVPLKLSPSVAFTRVKPLHILLPFFVLHFTDFFKALNFTMSSQVVEQVSCKYRLFYKSGVLNWGLPLGMLGLLSWSAAETDSCPPQPQHPFSPSSLTNRTRICWEWQYVQLEAYISHHSLLVDCRHMSKIWLPRCKQKYCMNFPEIQFKREECPFVLFFYILTGTGS